MSETNSPTTKTGFHDSPGFDLEQLEPVTGPASTTRPESLGAIRPEEFYLRHAEAECAGMKITAFIRASLAR